MLSTLFMDCTGINNIHRTVHIQTHCFRRTAVEIGYIFLATNPFEGQTKLMLSEKPVNKWLVIHLHYFKIVIFFWLKNSIHLHIMLKFNQQSENLDEAITAHFNIINNHSWHQDHVTCWTNEKKAIGQQSDSRQ